MSGTTTSESSAPLRLARGEIPTNWSQPAEAVTQLPQPARRPLLSATIALVGVAFCVGFAIVMIPANGAPTTPVHGAQLALPVDAPPPPGPAPVTEIPVPPKTSSTIPANDLAPEDQGGDAPRAAVEQPAAQPAEQPAEQPAGQPAGQLGQPAEKDSPGRAKARLETTRAIKLLAAGDAAGAEKPLIRATLADKTYPDAWRHLGIARAQLGDRAGARRAYKRYLELAPTAPDAADVRKILAE